MINELEKKQHIEISVIIPAYNCESTIEECLNSVFDQTYFSKVLEIVVVNDGSKDNTKEIIESYIQKKGTNKIKLINQENRGVSAARNNGIKISKGNWIAFLDSDDKWLNNKIERQISTILENRDIKFLGTLSTDSPQLYLFRKKIDYLYNANIYDLCYKSFPCTPSIMVQKDCLLDVGLFDEKQKYSEDMNCFQKICVKYNYYILPEVLVTCGFQKNYFAESGLTSNLKGMYEGRNKNLKELYKNSYISIFWYVFFRAFSYIKYWRRRYIRYIKEKKNV